MKTLPGLVVINSQAVPGGTSSLYGFENGGKGHLE